MANALLRMAEDSVKCRQCIRLRYVRRAALMMLEYPVSWCSQIKVTYETSSAKRYDGSRLRSMLSCQSWKISMPRDDGLLCAL